MSGFSVDILIVTHNAKEKLKKCIESVLRNTSTIDYQLTVLDNHSRDGTSQMLKSFGSKVRLIKSRRNCGFSGGANIAIRATQRKFIILIDDDARVTKDWLVKLFGCLQSGARAGIVGCKIVFPDSRIFSAQVELVDGELRSGKYEMDRGQRDYVKDVDMVNGACWLMKRKLIDRVGFFDEDFFPSQFEDLDYCLRARRAGYKVIYCGKVKIIHDHLLRDGGKKQNDRNSEKFWSKWRKLRPPLLAKEKTKLLFSKKERDIIFKALSNVTDNCLT